MTFTVRIFESAGSFRQSLEVRLNGLSKSEGINLARLRKQVAFERLLARLFQGGDPIWLLKGGYALELWLEGVARATKDIDLSIPYEKLALMEHIYSIVDVHEALQDAAEMDLGDWFEFRISKLAVELDGAPYGGIRFKVEAFLDGRLFAIFKLDVGIGDAVIGEPEWRTGNEHLSFAGIPPAKIALIPRAQQFAEKLHAYTHPRDGTVNSRPKDLLDMVLLIKDGLKADRVLIDSVNACFTRRQTHDMPINLPEPPADWPEPFARLVREVGSNEISLVKAYRQISEFWITAQNNKEE